VFPFTQSEDQSLLEAHLIVILETRELLHRAIELGDEVTNDFLVSDVLRMNELQIWFLNEHLVRTIGRGTETR